MLEILKAFIYGIVEGITEWLPVSSTGHLILFEKLIPFQNVSDDFFEMYEVVIQLGAIMAVVILFWNQLWPFVFSKEKRQGKTGVLSYVNMDIMTMWFKILVSCVPAAAIGLLFDDVLDAVFYRYEVVAAALIVFGIAFIIIENWNKGRTPKVNSIAELSYQMAVWIGVFQLIAAVFPGTSRSGATIVGALLIGVSRKVASEYTFFLAIPVMFGASLLKLLKFGFDFTATELICLVVGCVVAFVVSVFVLRFLLNYIKKHDFKVFGWYRIILGVVVLITFGFFF
ncbi:MAG: undecaprenyl-diphosphate phosphatase [Lachnospiraceae bacterium]|nr:undecaprenyl-diphosphate phosphatase [Lachnospiraceae bacterium]